MIDFENPERQDFPRLNDLFSLGWRAPKNAREQIAVGLTLVMLGLLLGCYALGAALVLFAEQVIRPGGPEGADAAELPQSDTVHRIGTH